jgi:ribonuclease D
VSSWSRQVLPSGEEPGLPLAFDTEFVSERRYTPRLCLIQIFCAAQPVPIEAAIDPFSVDLAPLLRLFADPQVTKIVHAGAADLQILWASYKCRVASLFDTQIAGAFLGYGHQAGYAELVRRVANGPTLSKAQQFTDWAARPLSSNQVSYALDDVRYLPVMYEKLHGALMSRGRARWARAEFERAIERAAEDVNPDELWRRFNLSGLSRRQLGALRELASAREKIAQSLDKPPSFIVPDLTLLQMAKLPPANANEMRNLRGMPSTSPETSRALLDALQAAAKLSDEDLPRLAYSTRPDPQAEVVSGLLNVVTQLRADENEISRSYLAPREQLNALAAWWLKADSPAPDLPVLRDWRRELSR